MRYRRLNKEELEPLNEEFLKYLLVANITPESWEHLKKEDPVSCEKHLDVFSDLVFEKILTNIQFVDRILPKRIEVYQFLKERVLMYSLEALADEDFSFNNENLTSLELKDFQFIEGKKSYKVDKNVEVFNILQLPNAKISQGVLFKNLALKVAEQKESTK